MPAEISAEDINKVGEFCRDKPMSLAVVRTPEAPSELMGMFEKIASACGLSFGRNISSPSSDFGFAELYSNDRMLVVLYIGGARTELVSLAEIDLVFLQDLEETVTSSNIQSSSIRDGL
jgi:hypothetical protein